MYYLLKHEGDIVCEIVDHLELNEAIWRNHYQIITAAEDDVECINPQFYGSAFRLQYRDKNWLVTADHVLHPEKHGLVEVPEGQNADEIEHCYFLVNNINETDRIATIFTKLFGFYFYNVYDDTLSDLTEEELKELGATDEVFWKRIDVSFCDISAGLPKQALTHDLHDNYGNLVVKPGLPKLSLLPESIAEPSADKTYYDFGVINNHIEENIRFCRTNAPYGDLRYIEAKDGLFRFQCPFHVIYDNWAALSGSLMFDSDGLSVGMSVRVDPDSDSVWVMPMKTILRLIDYAIAHENSNS